MADDEGESNSCDQITEYQYIKKRQREQRA